MAGEELQVVRLRDDFYRDGFYKVLIALVTMMTAIGFLIALSLYLYLAKPAPVNFSADNEWRLLPPIPVDQVYLNPADLVQWVSETLPSAFTFDFVNYTRQLKEKAQYFTPNGWKKYLDHVNVYANYNSIDKAKQFLNSNPTGAPTITNQGLLNGRYAWWVQMPMDLNYITAERKYTVSIVLQVLVVRVPTLNNLYGVGIDNMVIANQAANQAVNQAPGGENSKNE